MFSSVTEGDCLLGVCHAKPLSSLKQLDPNVSKIGGTPAWHDTNTAPISRLTCRVCGGNENMAMAAQVYAPTEILRTLYVFVCNKRNCSLTSAGWTVIRNQVNVSAAMAKDQVSTQKIRGAGTAWDSIDKLDSVQTPTMYAAPSFQSFMGCTDIFSQDVSIESLTSLLESRDKSLVSIPQPPISSQDPIENTTVKMLEPALQQSTGAQIQGIVWPCFQIDEVMESDVLDLQAFSTADAIDDSSVVMSKGISDEKIADMISRYMHDEDDEELIEKLLLSGIEKKVAKLKGADKKGKPDTGKFGRSGTKPTSSKSADNQLDGDHDDGAATDSADSEAKLARQDQKSRTEELFQSRVGAEPKQVLRYAYGGQPLWCTSPSPFELAHPSPPPCERCGSPREFEMQLMPAILSLPLPLASVIDGVDAGSRVGAVLDTSQAAVLREDVASIGDCSSGEGGSGSIGDRLSAPTDACSNAAHIGERDHGTQQSAKAAARQSEGSVGSQSVPSLLERLGPGMDFGVVAIWSCPNSCPPQATVSSAGEGDVCYEYAVVQPPCDIS